MPKVRRIPNLNLERSIADRILYQQFFYWLIERINAEPPPTWCQLTIQRNPIVEFLCDIHGATGRVNVLYDNIRFFDNSGQERFIKIPDMFCELINAIARQQQLNGEQLLYAGVKIAKEYGVNVDIAIRD